MKQRLAAERNNLGSGGICCSLIIDEMAIKPCLRYLSTWTSKLASIFFFTFFFFTEVGYLDYTTKIVFSFFKFPSMCFYFVSSAFLITVHASVCNVNVVMSISIKGGTNHYRISFLTGLLAKLTLAI